jgi:hypothetical protein
MEAIFKLASLTKKQEIFNLAIEIALKTENVSGNLAKL